MSTLVCLSSWKKETQPSSEPALQHALQAACCAAAPIARRPHTPPPSMAQPVTASLVSKQIDIPDELVSKIADVRDNSTPTDWVLASLSSESEDLGLRVLGTGTGGVTELRELLTQENIFFGLVRTIETIDKTEAVKFVFISFVGEKIGVMRKARISTLRGGIQAAFDPFHCELLNLSSKEEVSEAAIKQELGAMFGGEVAYQQGLGSTV